MKDIPFDKKKSNPNEIYTGLFFRTTFDADLRIVPIGKSKHVYFVKKPK